MNVKHFGLAVVGLFCVTWWVAAAVSYLYNLTAHGLGAVAWGHCLRMAVIVGALVPTGHTLLKQKHAQ